MEVNMLELSEDDKTTEELRRDASIPEESFWETLRFAVHERDIDFASLAEAFKQAMEADQRDLIRAGLDYVFRNFSTRASDEIVLCMVRAFEQSSHGDMRYQSPEERYFSSVDDYLAAYPPSQDCEEAVRGILSGVKQGHKRIDPRTGYPVYDLRSSHPIITDGAIDAVKMGVAVEMLKNLMGSLSASPNTSALISAALDGDIDIESALTEIMERNAANRYPHGQSVAPRDSVPPQGTAEYYRYMYDRRGR